MNALLTAARQLRAGTPLAPEAVDALDLLPAADRIAVAELLERIAARPSPQEPTDPPPPRPK